MYWDGISPIRMASKDFDMFYRYYIESGLRIAWPKFTGEKIRTPCYGGHRVYSQNESNELLKTTLLSDAPVMFGRHGTNQ